MPTDVRRGAKSILVSVMGVCGQDGFVRGNWRAGVKCRMQKICDGILRNGDAEYG